jgi:hypothetical protein
VRLLTKTPVGQPGIASGRNDLPIKLPYPTIAEDLSKLEGGLKGFGLSLLPHMFCNLRVLNREGRCKYLVRSSLA